MLSVLILEDDPETRACIRDMAAGSEKIRIVGEAGSAREGVRLLCVPPDVVLLDLMLDDGPAFEFITIAKRNPATKVLVCSVLGDEESVLHAIRRGADGYIDKESSLAEMETAIESVMRDEAPMSPKIARHALRDIRRQTGQLGGEMADSPGKLSVRETQVLEALAHGLNYKEVARKYELSPHTVAKYIKTIYRKLAVSTRAEAVVTGLKSGLIHPK